MARLAAFILALVSILGPALPALSESRGLTVELRTAPRHDAPVAGTVALYDNSYALVIGNDAYTNGWPRLSNAVADATEVALALDRAGFEVTLETDLDSAGLRRTLRQFFAIKGSDPEARLLVWYAGHGHSIDGEGFLVPVDAARPGMPTFKFDAVQMRDFGSLMRLASAKHVLAVFDSCFAGTVFSTRAGGVPPAITRVTARPVRQFLTSGDADQQVGDDGTFRRLFLRALAGETGADVNSDGYLTGTELGLFMSDRLANYSGGAQTPRYGKLRDPDFDRGDFVFSLPARDAGPPTPRPEMDTDAMIEEIRLWSSVKDSDDPEIVQAYLDLYPTGRFAKTARARIASLDSTITTDGATWMPAPATPRQSSDVVNVPNTSVSNSAVSEPQVIDGSGVTVGFSQVGNAGSWRPAYSENMKKKAAEYGIDLQFADANGRQEEQLRAVRAFIARDVDAIVIAPVVVTGWVQVLREAKRAGIPVFFTDRDVDVSDKSLYVARISNDFAQEGRTAANWLAEKTGGTCSIVEIRGTRGSAAAIERQNGFMSVIDQFPGMRIVASAQGDFDVQSGFQAMNELIKKTDQLKDICAVYAHNDNMQIGAISALKQAGISPGKDVLMVSVDYVPAMRQALDAGEANASVELSAKVGDYVYPVVLNYLNGSKDPRRWVVIPPEIHTAEAN